MHQTINITANITAAIIAGGQSRRMEGHDKCLLRLGNGTILDAIIRRLSPQVSRMVINSNRDPRLYESFSLPVVPDASIESLGPLSGVASVLAWLKDQEHRSEWLLTVPSDTPFLPPDLVDKLYRGIQRENREISYALSDRPHFLTALWPVDIYERLQIYIDSGGRAVKDFFATCDSASVEFIGEDIDSFFNINTPEDYQRAKCKVEPRKKVEP